MIFQDDGRTWHIEDGPAPLEREAAGRLLRCAAHPDTDPVRVARWRYVCPSCVPLPNG